MPGSDDSWHPMRLAVFVLLAVLIYLGLFVWSNHILEPRSDRNPFFRITQAKPHTDWIVLGASHALPLGFEGVPTMVRDVSGADTLTLAVAGGGPAVSRLVAERYFADHDADGVLVVLDVFAFLDPRWNEARLADADILPKIPADLQTLRVFIRAISRGLPARTVLAYATGFSRINDQSRFETDRWDAEARFDSAPRPSDAADAARISYLFPDIPSEATVERAFADIEAMVRLARSHGTRIVLVYPPLPERFRTRMPDLSDIETRLAAEAGRLGVSLIDHRTLIPESRYYFDTDHLNRAGVELWLVNGLSSILHPSE